ncbi:hypothetical protein SELMODRAFT_424082 [Selaginella moellendorffii]|uniref:ATPase domain-containing protein n=1 Tax=Selaginella moellendorffii TaxID=88036 RepID=D8SNR4_SELML|nr:hypothetical protein SELMODRAFT_424082 [Selaginella moellendorffii]
MKQLVGRERELRDLLGYVERRIDKIVLLQGPELSGKTALLRELRAVMASKYGRTIPVYHLDLTCFRMTDVLEWIQGTDNFLMEDSKDLTILEVIEEILASEHQLQPVFIIDQAERIPEIFPQPRALIEVLAKIARERRGVVILASLDDSLREDWHDQVLPFHLGYFSEKAARAFLRKRRAAEDRRPWWQRWWSRRDLVSDEEWREIYPVCGGCPRLLGFCVSPYPNLSAIVGSVVGGVHTGLEGRDGEWEGDKYRRVAELLVENEGSLEWSVVLDKVFGKDVSEGSSQLRAMAARNMINVEYLPESKTKVVMAGSPAYLYAMRLVLEGRDEPDV